MSSMLQSGFYVSAIGIGLFLILLLLILGLASALGRVKPAPLKAPPDHRAVLAPGAGSVVSIAIHPGGTVAIGQELCILETVRAKTAVRAGRVGVISTIFIAPGDTVGAGQVLMEFGD